MSDSEAFSGVVLELAEEFLERYRKGERPPLAEYTHKHPDLADEIREVFPAMAMMENIAIEDQSLADGAAAQAAAEPSFKQLGDYRILREVGRGGMGIVYEAEQLALGRRVALKVLPQQFLLDQKHKRRFEREAKAAARLHHTNIVPVFGVGEQDGLCYYVMQFIQGLGLDVVIGELQKMREVSLAGRASFQGEAPVSRAGRDAPAARVARSLMTGQFARTLLTEADAATADGTAHLGSTIGYDPDENAVPIAPSHTQMEMRQSGAGPVEKLLETSGLSDSSYKLPDSLALSGSFSLPGQSDTSVSMSGSRARRKQTFWTSVANIGQQVASALQYAHEQGITHRDIKPSNLLLDMRGTVWVTDFGLAKSSDQQDITHTGDILGTLRYMPPEAFEGISDARSDLYSLGLTLYELLAQRPAFDDKDRHKLVKLVTTTEPQRIEKLNADVPRDLATIVHKAIDRDPGHRYQSARELVEDLQRFLEDEPIKARPVTSTERLARWSRHNKGLAASLAGIAALVVLIAIGSSVAAGYFRTVAREKTKLADDNARLAADQTKLADEKTRLAEEKETERRSAEQAKTEALAAKTEIEQQAAEIDRQRERAERSLYVSQISLAERHLDVADSLNAGRSLEAAMPAQGETDRRGWEWFYLSQWGDSTTRQLEGHSTEWVSAVAVSPDGRWLASAGGGNPYYANPMAIIDPGEVLVRDFDTGRIVHILEGHENIVTTLAFSPDGQWLATGGHDQRLVVWDVATGESVLSIDSPHKPRLAASAVRTIEFSPDRSRLLVQWSHDVLDSFPVATAVYAVPQGNLLKEFETRSAIFSLDGAEIYYVDSEPARRIRSLNMASLESSDFLQSPFVQAPLFGLTKCRATGRLATMSGEEILLWDLSSRELIQRFPAPLGTGGLAFSPDGRWLAARNGSNVAYVWDARDGRKVGTLMGNTGPVSSVAFSADSQWLVTAAQSGEVRLFRAGQDSRGMAIPTGQYQLCALAFSADGTAVRTASWIEEEHPLATWEVGSSQPVSKHTLPVSRSRAWPRGDFAFSRDGTRLAAACEDNVTVKVWDAVSGEELHSLPHGQSKISAVEFSGDGALLATGADTPIGVAVQLWDARSGERIRTISGVGHHIQAFAFSPDGKWLATGGVPYAELWPAVTLWDIGTGKPKCHFPEAASTYGLDMSPDGTRLAAADYHLSTVHVWDIAEGQKLAEMTGMHAVSDVAFSPDGLRLAAIGYDADVHLWNARTFEELLILRTLGPPTGSLGFTPRLAFSLDGSRIAGNSAHGVISIWDAGSRFVGHDLNSLFTEAQQHLEDEEFEEAASAATLALKLPATGPSLRRLQARIWFVLSECRRQQGDPAAAEDSLTQGRILLEQVLSENPNDTTAITVLITSLLGQDDAVIDSAHPWFQLAKVYLAGAQTEKAAAALLRAAGAPNTSAGQSAVAARLDEISSLEFEAAAARVREIAAAAELAALSQAVAEGPDSIAALQARGVWFVRNNRWAEAAADFSDRAERDATLTSIDWMRACALWAYADDAERHRQQVQKMAEHFRPSTDTADAERTVKVMLLVDGGLELEPVQVDGVAAASPDTLSPGLRKWFIASQALVACRRGQFEVALQLVNQSLLLAEQDGEPRGSFPTLIALAVRALTLARQNDHVQARPALDELKMLLGKSGLKWSTDGTVAGASILNEELLQHDQLIPEILRREAERVLATQAAAPAPADETPTTEPTE